MHIALCVSELYVAKHTLTLGDMMPFSPFKPAMKCSTFAVLLTLACTATGGEPPIEPENSPDPKDPTVSIYRDARGVPHIRAATDEGAMYGLGYAAAQDRLAQMNLYARTTQGRMAEIAGPDFVNSDINARRLGTWRHAQRVVASLPQKEQRFLEAYAEGVNDYVADHPDALSPLFDALEFKPQQWTPAHSLAVWYRIAALFQKAPFHKASPYYEFKDSEREIGTEAAAAALLQSIHPGDPEAGVVQGDDVPKDVQDAIYDYYIGLQDAFDGETEDAREPAKRYLAPMNYNHESPKFSHAWVVSGDRTTTGKAALVSDPQTPVSAPAIWYEWQATGETLNVRGIGLAGTPGLLIGFNEHIAWGLTAAGVDMADIFRLEMVDDTHYLVDGETLEIKSEPEVIAVAGGDDVKVMWQNTVFGPIVTDLVQNNQGDTWAYKGAPLHHTDSDTFEGSLGLMQAQSITDVREAADKWHYPSANLVAAARDGDIFYTLLGDIPIRSFASPVGGLIAQEGNSAVYDWEDLVPAEYKPWVLNPAKGYIASANHRPAGDWYPLPIQAGTGGKGHTVRSYRLVELLDALPQTMDPQTLLDSVQTDCVNAARRDIVALARHVERQRRGSLSEASVKFLVMTSAWSEAGGSMTTDTPAAELAALMDINFRPQTTGTALQRRFGGGGNGLTLFLKTMIHAVTDNPNYRPDAAAIAYLDTVLSTAWRRAGESQDDLKALNEAYLERASKDITLFASTLTGLGTDLLDVTIEGPAVTCPDYGTIWSQQGQSYTQFVSFEKNDQAMMPPGNSEDADGDWFDNQQLEWLDGTLFPAPLGPIPPTRGGAAFTLTYASE